MNTWTINKLIQSSARLKSWRGNWANYRDLGTQVGEVKFIPFLGTRSLLINSQYIGVSQAPKHHNVNLFFEQCEILTEVPTDSSWRRDYFAVNYNGQIYYIKNLSASRNPVRIRCSCFTGDTKILLADGTSKPIADLVNTDFEVFAYNEVSHQFEIAKAFNCEKKKENAKLLKVTLDNGAEIKCTPDHRFLTRDGNWITADTLNVGTSLRALYYKEGMDLSTNSIIENHLNDDKYYVYVYLDPTKPGEYNYTTCSFNYEPIYVGKGCGRRFRSHLSLAKKNKGETHFIRRLRKILALGYEPIILQYACNLMENKAFDLERKLTEDIGLLVDSNGPLLNCRLGGEGGIGSVSAEKIRQTNLERGRYKEASKRMQINNPMFDKAVVEKTKETQRQLGLYSSEHMKKLSNARTSETFEKMIQTRIQNYPDAFKNWYEKGIEWRAEHIKNGTYHTQSQEWKNAQAKRSKQNWQDPELRKKMLQSAQLVKDAKRRHKEQFTLNTLTQLIRQDGFLDKQKYQELFKVDKKNLYSINTLETRPHNALIKQAKESAFFNHKVVSVEPIENADVYCLSVAGLMNFVIDTSDVNSMVISGVTVENCADFYYRWAWADFYGGNCLYGPSPKVYRPVAGSKRGPVNPNNVIGICKHVLGTVKGLEQKGIIKY